MSDLWKTPGAAEAHGYDGDAELDFGLMIRIKGRPPSRKAQFCTFILKLNPQRAWIQRAFGPGGPYEGEAFTRYAGVRRDESPARAGAQRVQWDNFFDCELVYPVVDWSKQQCFDFVRARGERVNPLYSLGFNRVGCAPCINSSREDIRNWAMRFPEVIDKVRARGGRQAILPVILERPACESKYGLCD